MLEELVWVFLVVIVVKLILDYFIVNKNFLFGLFLFLIIGNVYKLVVDLCYIDFMKFEK